MMSASQVVFYLVSALMLGFGLLSVISRKIFRSAIFLLLSLTSMAGIFFMLSLEFLAAVQIVVYVGGIVVLIIFAIFLTHKSGEELPLPKKWLEAVAFFISTLSFGVVFSWINRGGFFFSGGQAMDSSVKTIGRQLLATKGKSYLIPFELISILLLVAMIGAIVIAIRSKQEEKSQSGKALEP